MIAEQCKMMLLESLIPLIGLLWLAPAFQDSRTLRFWFSESWRSSGGSGTSEKQRSGVRSMASYLCLSWLFPKEWNSKFSEDGGETSFDFKMDFKMDFKIRKVGIAFKGPFYYRKPGWNCWSYLLPYKCNIPSQVHFHLLSLLCLQQQIFLCNSTLRSV